MIYAMKSAQQTHTHTALDRNEFECFFLFLFLVSSEKFGPTKNVEIEIAVAEKQNKANN